MGDLLEIGRFSNQFYSVLLAETEICRVGRGGENHNGQLAPLLVFFNFQQCLFAIHDRHIDIHDYQAG